MPQTATHPVRRLAAARVALAVAVLGLAGGALIAAPPAEARGFGLSVGIPFGGPAYYPAYYPPAYYYAPPPPVYYPPPPAAYAPPPPVAYAPPPQAAVSNGCREYQSSAMIDGRPTATHGVACRQPDGSWRIVQ